MANKNSTAKYRRPGPQEFAPIEYGRQRYTVTIPGIATASKATGTYLLYLVQNAPHAGTIKSGSWIQTDDGVASTTAQLFRSPTGLPADKVALTAAIDIAGDTVPTDKVAITFSATAITKGDAIYVDMVTGGSETLANFSVEIEVEWSRDDDL